MRVRLSTLPARCAIVLCASSLSGCAAAPPAAVTTPTQAAAASEPAVGDGAPHEAENQRYRERGPVPPASQQVLDAARRRVLTRLEAGSASPTAGSVRAALDPDVESGAWVVQEAHSVAFEAQVGQAGCLVGTVAAKGVVRVETAGFIADGGCHALTGH